MELPTWLYSKDGEAREVKTPDEALKLLKDGWEDTPAAFEEGYVRPAPPEKGKAAPNGGDGYKPAPFPSWRYHEDGSSREVKSADELRTLGPGWHDSPDPETWKTPEERAAARDTAPAAVAEAAGAAAGHSLSEQLVAEKARADALERDLAELRKASASPAQPPVVEEAPQPSAEDLEKAGQYEAHVSTLKRVIAGLTDVAVLEKVQRYEMVNPKGSRASVLNAVQERIAALSAPPAAPEPAPETAPVE